MIETVPLFQCSLDADARRAIDPVLSSGALAAGPFVDELEQRLDAFHPRRTSVVMSNMTLALTMALRLAGVGPNDDVLTIAFNCLSSNSAIAMIGARAIWVDVNPHTLTIDIEDCKNALTAKTKALVVYHIAGYPADLIALEAFCRAHEIVLIEDANNALGARSADRLIGTVGAFSILSFYANRQINAIEGAALLCADPYDAERARRLRRFGVDLTNFRDHDGEIAPNVEVPEIGLPASMANLNACLACHQFDKLELRLQKTRDNAEALRRALIGSNLKHVAWQPQDAPAFWTFVIRSTDRDNLMRALKAAGVQCSKLHQRNDRYSGFTSPKRDLKGTTILEQEMLALPVGWWVTRQQLLFIINVLKTFSLNHS
jgi:perosamine synthetase